mmetsp:Transcript_28412/g.70595  ORF Transcript_28412/g.70595 Transcript_28412/m.70595 type:complete len:203 (+) Transcript_28412:671-1279(+)
MRRQLRRVGVLQPAGDSLLVRRALRVRKHQLAQSDQHFESDVGGERGGVPAWREAPDRLLDQVVRQVEAARRPLELERRLAQPALLRAPRERERHTVREGCRRIEQAVDALPPQVVLRRLLFLPPCVAPDELEAELGAVRLEARLKPRQLAVVVQQLLRHRLRRRRREILDCRQPLAHLVQRLRAGRHLLGTRGRALRGVRA